MLSCPKLSVQPCLARPHHLFNNRASASPTYQLLCLDYAKIGSRRRSSVLKWSSTEKKGRDLERSSTVKQGGDLEWSSTKKRREKRRGQAAVECSRAMSFEQQENKVEEGNSSSSSKRRSKEIMERKSLWSKVTQSVNVKGVYFSAKVILKDRKLAIPHVSVPDISWVDWKALRARGFQGVLFDKDNTLTAPYELTVWPPLNDSLHECRTAFEGRIALLSNSAGLLQYDPSGAEAKAVEDTLGIPVIRHGQKKPAGNALAVAKHFGCDPSKLIMVGDRYFTDVVYGNSNGLFTIRPAPLTSEGEPFVVKKVRVLEETLVDLWRRQGVLPTKHVLFDSPVDFVRDPGCW